MKEEDRMNDAYPTFKLGRNKPVARGPRLSMKNYTLKSLPEMRRRRR